ncbi:MAG: PhoH family protein [Planctomycetota bacterium]|jgi:phosphate starvation-inducible PhoH-like protein
MSESTLTLGDPQMALQLFGPQDTNLRRVRNQLGVAITHRNGQIRIAGPSDSVRMATEILEQLRDKVMHQGTVGPDEVDDIMQHCISSRTTQSGERSDFQKLERREVAIGNVGRRVKPRTPGQAGYIEAIRTHDMTFCIGPAGCGKTYLAVATAVEAYRAKQMRKIVLVRPAVEAGESLGYLPGDLNEKLNPYLRPLLDAINEMVDFDQVKFLMEQDIIEVIPLAYMRGRTLNSAFVILDEAQNATVAQMKMFLTRMGEGSKVVVSGDISQVDLPAGVTSGLRDAAQRLQGIEGIAMVRLHESDIVRHPLVQRIVAAYEGDRTYGPKPRTPNTDR